jgi:hypothetical protein
LVYKTRSGFEHFRGRYLTSFAIHRSASPFLIHPQGFLKIAAKQRIFWIISLDWPRGYQSKSNATGETGWQPKEKSQEYDPGQSSKEDAGSSRKIKKINQKSNESINTSSRWRSVVSSRTSATAI